MKKALLLPVCLVCIAIASCSKQKTSTTPTPPLTPSDAIITAKPAPPAIVPGEKANAADSLPLPPPPPPKPK